MRQEHCSCATSLSRTTGKKTITPRRPACSLGMASSTLFVFWFRWGFPATRTALNHPGFSGAGSCGSGRLGVAATVSPSATQAEGPTTRAGSHSALNGHSAGMDERFYCRAESRPPRRVVTSDIEFCPETSMWSAWASASLPSGCSVSSAPSANRLHHPVGRAPVPARGARVAGIFHPARSQAGARRGAQTGRAW